MAVGEWRVGVWIVACGLTSRGHEDCSDPTEAMDSGCEKVGDIERPCESFCRLSPFPFPTSAGETEGAKALEQDSFLLRFNCSWQLSIVTNCEMQIVGFLLTWVLFLADL